MASQEYAPGTSKAERPQPTHTETSATLSSAAQDAVQRVREEAAEVAGHVQDKARTFLDEQKEAVADHLDGVSRTLHETVDRLREKSPGALSDYAERAVQGVDSLAATLRDQDVRTMVRTVEDFARRQPAVFVAGAVAAGFALARFLKSSSHKPLAGAGQPAQPRTTEFRAHLDTSRERAEKEKETG
jgi:hypothetical protein